MIRPKLNKQILPSYSGLELPERIIQFGNGVLLRGLPDYYVHNSNESGVFKGRIVVVKSTDQGSEKYFDSQDYLFTHIIKGIENNLLTESHFINSSISRLLTARSSWHEILACAENPDIDIVFSNTTEKGIVYVEESINQNPPVSFPGKLLAYLDHRFNSLGDTDVSSMIIIPTELIENNGDVLKSVLLRLFEYNQLQSGFIDWFNKRITICNSLVDRIVPGFPMKDELPALEEKLGYKDDYLIISEPYNLWAIEGDESVKDKLSFSKVNPGIKIEPNINKYREIKLRLLNATHSFSAALALFEDLPMVVDVMEDSVFSNFIADLMEDIKICLSDDIDDKLKNEFAESVKQRFGNPYIHHYWTSIIFNYSQKFKIRCVPLIADYFKLKKDFSSPMLKGLKAYIDLSIPDYYEDGKYFKKIKNKTVQLSNPASENLYLNSLKSGYNATFTKHLHELFNNYDKGFIRSLLNYFDIQSNINFK